MNADERLDADERRCSQMDANEKGVERSVSKIVSFFAVSAFICANLSSSASSLSSAFICVQPLSRVRNHCLPTVRQSIIHHMKSPRVLALLIFLPATLDAQYSRDRPSLVLRGEEALQRQELGVAMDAFRAAARDTSVARRAAAERMLGVIAWRFYHENDRARKHFGAALATQYDSAATFVELARLAIAERRYRQAFTFANRARISAQRDVDERGAILQMARAVTEAGLAARLDGAAGSEQVDSAAVASAVAELSSLVR